MSIEKMELQYKINELEIKYRELEIEYYSFKNKILTVKIELEEAEVSIEDLTEFYENSIKSKYSDDEIEEKIKKIESNPISEEKKEDFVVYVDDDEFKLYSIYKLGAYTSILDNLTKEKISLLKKLKSLNEELLEKYY